MTETRRARLNDAAARLTAAGVPDARLDAEWLLAAAVGAERLPMLLAADAPLSEAEALCFDGMVARRCAREPLQYILGRQGFMGHDFRADARALIPRADTETLCEEAIARLRPGARALDLGTGTGALAISMALACPGALVTAADISEAALALAMENAAALGAPVRFAQSDLFCALHNEAFDLIVSNPPYIPTAALAGLQREVRFEPPLALDGGADGLHFYKRIVSALPGRLKQGGALLFEVGDGQAEAVAALMRPCFGRVRAVRDLRGCRRVVIGDEYAG